MSPGEAILTTLLRQSRKRHPQRAALAEWAVEDLPPTLVKATSCEACGHPIKRTVKLFNESTRATLIVGYDCYEHFSNLSKGLQISFTSVGELRKERELTFIRVVERGHIEILKHARPLDSGTWTSWIVAQGRHSKSLDPLVLQGIEAIKNHGFIFSARQLAACIRHHDEFRVFQAALIYGEMWPKLTPSAQSPCTISEGRARLTAYLVAEKQRATMPEPAPQQKPRTGSPPAGHGPLPSLQHKKPATVVLNPKPAAPTTPTATATATATAAREVKQLPFVTRINTSGSTLADRSQINTINIGSGSTADERKTNREGPPSSRQRSARHQKNTRLQASSERRSAELVRRGTGVVEPVKQLRAEANLPAPEGAGVRTKSIVDLEEHESLREQAKALIELQSGVQLPKARTLRLRFLSQISRVEGASKQGTLAESTRPLNEIREALELLERQLGMR
ncbi:MAG: hypothetical protein Q8L14_12805 [Myxococcales bacterium]|nr:hypothetical protein [Myxococcales bacterium]